MTDEWLYLDDPEIRFRVSNEAVLDDYGTRLVDLCKSGDDEGFLSLFAELEAFCRAGGEDGERYWEWYYAGDDRADTARFRIAAAKDPRPPREQVEAFIEENGPVPSGVVYTSFPDSFDARGIVAALKKEKKVVSVRIGTPYLYFPCEGMEEKLAAIRESWEKQEVEKDEMQQKYEAGEFDEGLSFDVGKMYSIMEDKAVEYGLEHVKGFNEAKFRKKFRKDMKADESAAPRKSFIRRLFGK